MALLVASIKRYKKVTQNFKDIHEIFGYPCAAIHLQTFRTIFFVKIKYVKKCTVFDNE